MSLTTGDKSRKDKSRKDKSRKDAALQALDYGDRPDTRGSAHCLFFCPPSDIGYEVSSDQLEPTTDGMYLYDSCAGSDSPL